MICIRVCTSVYTRKCIHSDRPVLHIYRYILKVHFIPIFSECMCYALCIILPLHSIQVDRAGGKVSHKCHFPASSTELHLLTATVTWCLTVAAMIVVLIRLPYGVPQLDSVWMNSLPGGPSPSRENETYLKLHDIIMYRDFCSKKKWASVETITSATSHQTWRHNNVRVDV